MARLTDKVIYAISSLTLAAFVGALGLAYFKMKQPVSQEPKPKERYVTVYTYIKNESWIIADRLVKKLGIELPDSFYKWNNLRKREWIKPGRYLLIGKERMTRKEAAIKYGY